MIKVLIFMKTNWVFFSLVILTSITALSLWPVSQLPDVPGTDKTHHLIAYAALVFPLALRKPAHWRLIALSLVVYSGVIELIQPYVNRYGEWLDLAANAAGIVCGFLLVELIVYFFPAIRHEQPAVTH